MKIKKIQVSGGERGCSGTNFAHEIRSCEHAVPAIRISDPVHSPFIRPKILSSRTGYRKEPLHRDQVIRSRYFQFSISRITRIKNDTTVIGHE
jgi:hypothetical protein